MSVIYIIIKFILFPGTYIRGFWENLTCKVLHLEVESDGYLRPDEACGHVEHSLPDTKWGAWLMATGPGFMCFCSGVSLLWFGSLNLFYMGITFYDSAVLFIIYVISFYLGFSLLCSLFPLTEDIINYWSLAFGFNFKKKNIVVDIIEGFFTILSFPIALITRIGAVLEKYCITFLILVAYIVFHIVIL